MSGLFLHAYVHIHVYSYVCLIILYAVREEEEKTEGSIISPQHFLSVIDSIVRCASLGRTNGFQYSCRNLLFLSLTLSFFYFLVSLFLSLFYETIKTIANEHLGTRQESRGQWSDFSVSQGNMNPEKPSDRSIGERHPERWLSRSRPRNPTATWVNQSRTKESRYAVTGQHARLRSLVAIDLAVVVDVGILMTVGSPSSDVMR